MKIKVGGRVLPFLIYRLVIPSPFTSDLHSISQIVQWRREGKRLYKVIVALSLNLTLPKKRCVIIGWGLVAQPICTTSLIRGNAATIFFSILDQTAAISRVRDFRLLRAVFLCSWNLHRPACHSVSAGEICALFHSW